MPVQMGVQPRLQRVEASVDAVEPLLHHAQERVETGIHARRKCIGASSLTVDARALPVDPSA